jgi:hypothetical protein
MYIPRNVLFVGSRRVKCAGKSEEPRTIKTYALTLCCTVLVQRQNKQSSLGSEFEGIIVNMRTADGGTVVKVL